MLGLMLRIAVLVIGLLAGVDARVVSNTVGRSAASRVGASKKQQPTPMRCAYDDILMMDGMFMSMHAHNDKAEGNAVKSPTKSKSSKVEDPQQDFPAFWEVMAILNGH